MTGVAEPVRDGQVRVSRAEVMGPVSYLVVSGDAYNATFRDRRVIAVEVDPRSIYEGIYRDPIVDAGTAVLDRLIWVTRGALHERVAELHPERHAAVAAQIRELIGNRASRRGRGRLVGVQRPRLVASDIDGTLLAADQVPAPRTLAVLARMAEAGVPFVLATGRPPRWVPPVSAAVGSGLVVAANGAVLYDAADDRVLDVFTLDPPVVAEVLAGLWEALPRCGLAVERVAPGLTAREGEQFLADATYRPAWPGSDHDEVDIDELGALPVVKILAREVGRGSEDMARAARERLGDVVDVTHSASGGLVECSRKGVTKASGLAAAAARRGVDAADVVAFGDMPNDLEMLRWAGHGVAVGNAHPEVVAAADEVTASNLDDGVASVLERWF